MRARPLTAPINWTESIRQRLGVTSDLYRAHPGTTASIELGSQRPWAVSRRCPINWNRNGRGRAKALLGSVL